MRRSLCVFAAVVLTAVLFSACGSDRPSSFQQLIFGSWNAQSDPATFISVTFIEGSSPVVGTYTARLLTQGDPDNPDTISEIEENGTIGIAGSSLIVNRPGFPQSTWPFSVDGNTLTLTTNLGPEIYAR